MSKLVFLLAAMAALVVRPASAAEAPNLAPNPGFEDTGANGRPAAWSAPAPVYSLAEEGARTGRRCLRFENRDPKRYVLCTAPVELKPGKQYQFEAWVRTEGIEGADSGATICIEWYDKDRRWLGGSYPEGRKGTQRLWQRVVGLTPRVPDDAAGATIACYVRKGMTGVAWWDDVAVREYHPPLVEGMTTTAYRNLVAGGKVDVLAGIHLASYGLAPAGVQASLAVKDAAGRSVLTLAPARVTVDEVRFTLDAGKVKPGAYTLECSVQAKAGGAAGSVSCKLTRVEKLPQRKAYLDEHRRLIVDGKPFFPLGTYWGGITQKDMDIYARSPFNCVMPYGGGTREQLDIAQKAGIKVIYSVKDYYHGTKWCPDFIKSPEDERQALAAKVKEVGGHPAVIAWYINDELPLSMVGRLALHRDWMEELDPGRPTWVVLYQVEQVRAYLPSYDVIGTDPYPIPDAPASRALDWARQTVAGSFATRAVWMVPQIFDWASYRTDPEARRKCRPPSFEEMRSMAWQCIAAGANGLIFYSWSDLWRMDRESGPAREPFQERWADVTRMAEEIRRFFPVLLSIEKPAAPAKVDAPPAVAWRAYGKGGATYLLVVNSGAVPADAVFQFARPLREAQPESGAPEVKTAGKELRLRLKGLDATMVRVR